MHYNYYNKPKFIDSEAYNRVKTHIVDFYSKNKNILAIYQCGSVNHPGISDLDIICVVKDNKHCTNNIISPNKEFDYIITHGVSAISKKNFKLLENYTIWNNLKPIYGNDIKQNFSKDDLIKKQLNESTATEYFFKNYVDLYIQISYKAFNLRTLFQQMKGLKQDFELLSDTKNTLYADILQFYEIIDSWFDNKNILNDFDNWLYAFLPRYFKFIEDLLILNPIKMPSFVEFPLKFKNITFIQDNILKSQNFGKKFYKKIYFHKKIFRLNEKFINYTFSVPILSQKNLFVDQRAHFILKNYKYGKKYLRGFAPQIPSFYNYFCDLY
jgi:hypothetical protein